ncbi:hypothetical protein GCM10022254_50250 [Actinomadura meridiana]|uniref:Uncharacterized protein n=1 Tax=Actinomadura meridiana TaxID=559626 RepID=A0ABP8CD76_9ACTN
MSVQDPRLVPLTFREAYQAARLSPRTVRLLDRPGLTDAHHDRLGRLVPLHRAGRLQAEAKARGNAA